MDKHEYGLFYDGELELMLHQYWHIETTDLINWQDDASRVGAKKYLIYLWRKLRDACNKMKKNNNMSKMEKAHTERLNNMVEYIKKFARFGANNTITKACMYVIKQSLPIILDACVPDDNKRWFTFMKLLQVHHYMCPYTVATIAERVKSMAKTLKCMIIEDKAADNNQVTAILSNANIYELFSNVLTQRSKTGVKKLQEACNKLLYTVARSIGCHMVRYGIVGGVDKNIIITQNHLAGYIDSHKWYLVSVPERMPVLTSQKTHQLTEIIDFTIKSYCDTNDRGKHIKFPKETKEMIGAYARYVLFCATVGPMAHMSNNTNSKPITGNGAWCNILTEAVETYTNTYHCDIKNPDE